MNIAARHSYRFGYLKSDHWQNLRLEKLVEVDAHCYRCNLRDLANDVHHVNYRKLYDVQLSDLVVLCRACHGLMHEALDAVKNGEAGAALALAEKLRESRALQQPHQLNDLFKKMRLNGLLEKPEPVAIKPVQQEPEKRRPKSADFLSKKLSEGFGNPATKPLFLELRRSGFVAELQAAFPG